MRTNTRAPKFGPRILNNQRTENHPLKRQPAAPRASAL